MSYISVKSATAYGTVAVATWGSFKIAQNIGQAIQNRYTTPSNTKKEQSYKLVNFVSGLIGIAAGLFVANRNGLISVRDLTSRAVSYFKAAPAKVEVDQAQDTAQQTVRTLSSWVSTLNGDTDE